MVYHALTISKLASEQIVKLPLGLCGPGLWKVCAGQVFGRQRAPKYGVKDHLLLLLQGRFRGPEKLSCSHKLYPTPDF